MTTAQVVETTVPVNNNRTKGVLDMYLQEAFRGKEKPPTKNREKEGENRGNLGRNPASSKTEVKLTRRKGSVTTENDLHTKQPLFIQKY